MDGKVRVMLDQATTGWPDFREVEFLLDDGNELFVPSGRSSVAVADLDGDGRKDLVAGNTDGELLLYGNVGTDALPEFEGYTAILADDQPINLPGSPRSRPFIGDVNADGIVDLLIGSADGLVRLYRGTNATSGFAAISSQEERVEDEMTLPGPPQITDLLMEIAEVNEISHEADIECDLGWLQKYESSTATRNSSQNVVSAEAVDKLLTTYGL